MFLCLQRGEMIAAYYIETCQRLTSSSNTIIPYVEGGGALDTAKVSTFGVNQEKLLYISSTILTQ